MGKDVIIACDFADKETALNFLDKFEGRKPFVKIGMELFYAEGPQIVREIKARGHKIFLDLKLHDIPNTVKKSMAVLSQLDVDMCNLHAAGTSRMMEAALEGLTRPDGTRPLLIAVTQLTSTDQEAMERDLLIKEPIDKVVMHYAETAKNAGLDGVVCSPLEAQKVHDICGEKFLTVTPGVRFADGDIGDQKRVMTPEQAKKIGSDYIRLTLTAPEVRTDVETGLKELIEENYPEAEVLMGTSTAGIAHAAITAHLMNLPMGYVRSGNKDHGRQNRIEGKLEKGQKVVVVEDLISTGGSVIEVVDALREVGAEVLGIVSIFTYGMKKGLERLAAADVKNVSLTNLDVLSEVAAQEGYIKPEDVNRLIAFRNNPSDESWIGGAK